MLYQHKRNSRARGFLPRQSRDFVAEVLYRDDNVVVFCTYFLGERDQWLNRHGYSSYRMWSPVRFEKEYEPHDPQSN